jgi:hypothetical protein
MQGGPSALRCDDPRPLVAVGAGCPRGPTPPLTFARNILESDVEGDQPFIAELKALKGKSH